MRSLTSVVRCTCIVRSEPYRCARVFLFALSCPPPSPPILHRPIPNPRSPSPPKSAMPPPLPQQIDAAAAAATISAIGEPSSAPKSTSPRHRVVAAEPWLSPSPGPRRRRRHGCLPFPHPRSSHLLSVDSTALINSGPSCQHPPSPVASPFFFSIGVRRANSDLPSHGSAALLPLPLMVAASLIPHSSSVAFAFGFWFDSPSLRCSKPPGLEDAGKVSVKFIYAFVMFSEMAEMISCTTFVSPLPHYAPVGRSDFQLHRRMILALH